MRNTTRLGRRQKHALNFIDRCLGWHTFADDSKTIIFSLAKRGLVEVNDFKQFRTARGV